MTIKYYAFVEDLESYKKLEGIELEFLRCTDMPRMEELIQQTHGAIIFLEHQDYYDVYSVCQSLSQEYDHVSIILLEGESTLDLRKAIKSGASDVLSLKSTDEQFIQELRGIETRLQIKLTKERTTRNAPNSTVRSGKVVTVCSTKGGVGKTTFAVNYAVASYKKNQKVVVVDLNLQFGDVALFLDCKPKRTIYDWVKESQLRKVTFIDEFLTSFSDQIFFLAAPQRPEFAEVITGNDIKKLLKELKTKFDVIVIDTNSYMEENVLVALEESNDIYMMSYLDLPTLKNGKLLLETLKSLTIKGNVRIIVNKETKVKGLKPSIVEEILGLPVYVSLPNIEKMALNSVNMGKPLTLSNPRSKFSKKLFSLFQEGEISPRKTTIAKGEKKRLFSIEGNV